MNEPDFGQGGFLAFWNSLTPDEREALTKNLEEFHLLLEDLKNRGIIEADKLLTKITIFVRNEETDRLVELKELTNAQGINIQYK